MVVAGIFMILSTVVLSTNARFGNLIVLQNLANDMALSIREAQVYGIAVRRFEGINFDVSYGARFIIAPEGSPNTYVLFGDLNGNGLYDQGEMVNEMAIGGGYRIVELWARTAGTEVDTAVNELNVAFRRPEPDACISAERIVSFVNNKCVSTLDRARIVVQSSGGARAEIAVEASGQISVR